MNMYDVSDFQVYSHSKNRNGIEEFMNKAITMIIYTRCKCYGDCTPENPKL